MLLPNGLRNARLGPFRSMALDDIDGIRDAIVSGDVASMSVVVRSTARPLDYVCALTPSDPLEGKLATARTTTRSDGPHSPCDCSAMIRGGFCSHNSK